MRRRPDDLRNNPGLCAVLLVFAIAVPVLALIGVADGAVREWAAEPTTWGPSDARWVTPDSVAFTAHHAGRDTPEPVRRSEGALVRRGDWRLLAP